MVDVNGRALTIRARLPNPDLVLRPGLFARITVKGQSEAKVVVVPEEAVVPRGDSALLYRVESGKAVETKVRLGSRMAGHVEILEGLAPEAIVVTAGQTRLRNGALVEVVSSTVSSPGVTARGAL
jgi:membrane fusion protein, multidrug efflux system